MAHKDICLYASHHGTVGAGRNGIYEEPLFKKIVPRAVEILRQQGFNTVYTGGLTGHEMDQHKADANVYDVTISNHFNVGSAFVIYNPNRNNPNRVAFVNEVTTRLKSKGIHCIGGYPSRDYAMCNYGKTDNYLIEWANCEKPNELAWIADVEERAWDLADFVRKVFLDGKYASASRGGVTPQPTPAIPKPTGKTPEQTDGYGLVAEYMAPRGRITSHDPDAIMAFNDVLRTQYAGDDARLYNGEYFTSTDVEYLVRIKGDDNYIMRKSATTGKFFAIGTWLYDDYGQRAVDELYKIKF